MHLVSLRWRWSVVSGLVLAIVIAGCGRFGGPEQRGQQLLKGGDYEGAVKAFSEAITAGQDVGAAYAWRCYANLAAGHDEAAIADCDKALQMAPAEGTATPYKRWELLNNRAVAEMDLRKTDQAEADLKEALNLDPNYAEGHANLGRLYIDQEEWDQAITELTRAVQLDPNLAEAYGNRGRAHEAKGDTVGALADYGRAIDLSHDAQAYFNRGMLLYTLGRFAEAQTDLEAVSKYDKDPDSYLSYMAKTQAEFLSHRTTTVPTKTSEPGTTPGGATAAPGSNPVAAATPTTT